MSSIDANAQVQENDSIVSASNANLSSTEKQRELERNRADVLGTQYSNRQTFTKSNTNQLPREIRNRVKKSDADNIVRKEGRTFGSEKVKGKDKEAEEDDKPSVPMWVVYALLFVLFASLFAGIFGRGAI